MASKKKLLKKLKKAKKEIARQSVGLAAYGIRIDELEDSGRTFLNIVQNFTDDIFVF